MVTDAVPSTTLHPSGTVLATCSGQRNPITEAMEEGGSEKESDGSDDDQSSSMSSASSLESRSGVQRNNSLKVWAL